MARLVNILFCLLSIVVANTAIGETTFPYVAYISVPQSFARSGPNQQNYPTSQLAQGHAVEVYRHDADGWCAVRPPEGSFCWIPAHEIHRLSNTKAEVAVQSTVARVGSSVSPARSVVQVMLRRGEQVDLLPSGQGDDPRWLRIAPPAGEFRWIAANNLSRTPPVEGTQGIQQVAGWTRQRFHNEVQTVSGEADAFSHLLNTAPTTQSPQPIPMGTPQSPTSIPTPLGSDAIQVVAGSPAAQEIASSQGLAPPALLSGSTPIPQDGPADPRSNSTPRVRFNNSPTVLGPGSAIVQELQLRLSEIVIRPKEEWQFQQLQAEATALLEKSDSVSERDHLRNILDRIARFQQIQAGAPSSSTTEEVANDLVAGAEFTGMTSKVRELAKADLGAKDSEDPFDGGKEKSDPNTPRYDAVGRLKPVVSKSDDAPRYALVDDRGGVVSFVTPTPDLNLQPYLGMRIGVNGSRGFMPDYRKAHVTAGRVTPIEDRIRR